MSIALAGDAASGVDERTGPLRVVDRNSKWDAAPRL